MVKKNVGGTTLQTALQNVDYAYNIRGWLKAINDVNNLGSNDLFGFALHYNTTAHGGPALYNGNIPETEWRTANTDNTLKWYSYGYDALNRITNATDNTGNYNLTGVTYDKNGNIQTLSRNGWQNSIIYANMDVLDYDYDPGNKLLKVTDTGNTAYGFKDGTNTSNDYTYDLNGNMIQDLNKGITSISYNHLDLPTSISVANSEHNGNIEIIYAADGTKLKKTISTTGAVTEYAGNYVYENGQLKFFSHKEGYVEYESNGNFSYVYNYKDHLGSVRLSYSDLDGNGVISPSSEILKEQNTYPFGMPHKGYNGQVIGAENNYKTYLGQEINKELGLDWLTFRFRNYDPSIGRFFGVDPISEKFLDISTYQFAHNTPIWKIELEGLEGIKSQEFNPDGSFKNHVVEKNVVVLTQPLKKTPKGASERKVARINRQNERINKSNEQRIAEVGNELNNFFNGSGNQAKNSKGESVRFQFNVSGQEDFNKEGLSKDQINARFNQIANDNGIVGVKVSPDGKKQELTAPASVVTRESSGGLFGETLRQTIRVNFNSPDGSTSHEVLHTLGVNDNGYLRGGLLGSPPAFIVPNEVDSVIQNSFEQKQ